MIRTNAQPKDHFEGRWKKGKKYTLYAVVVNNGTKFRSITPKEKDEPYVIYDSTNETFSANSGWEIVEMSEDSRLSAMGGNGGGASGQDGKDAGFGTITASVSNTGGTPSVEVNTSGPNTAKNISFAFHNLKGAQGAPGVSNADIKVVDTLPEASSQTTGRIYLVETETAGTYARWYTEVDGTTYTWRQLGTTDVALEDYATKDNLSQLEAEVDRVSVAANTGFVYTEQMPTKVSNLQINYANTAFAITSSSVLAVHYVPITKGQTLRCTASHNSAQVFKYGFSESVPADGVAVIGGTRLEQATIDITLVSPVNGYFAAYHNDAYFADQSISTAVETPLSARTPNNLSDYLDFYSSDITKEIEIVGVGTTGSGVGVTKIGDIFYNTSKGKLRRAISQASATTFNYETIDPDYYALYVSPSSQYRYINEVFTEIVLADLGMLGAVIQNKYDIESLQKRHLKICLLGNSYTADCWRYVPKMLLNYGITCEIYLYYRGSGSLNDLYTQWTDYARYGIAESDNDEHVRFCSHIDTRLDKSWTSYPTEIINGETVNTKCARDIVAIGNSIGGWDLVVLQQVSVYTDVDPDNDVDGRYAHLGDIIDYIREECNYPFSLVWFQSYTRHSHDSATIRENTLINSKKVYNKFPFSCYIPVATAIFNARNNSTLATLGDSEYHNLWATDSIHLQEGLPCYIGALTVLQAIFNYLSAGKSVLNDTFRATTENITGLGLEATAEYPSVGVTDSNCYLAQHAAIMANRFPDVISDI